LLRNAGCGGNRNDDVTEFLGELRAKALRLRAGIRASNGNRSWSPLDLRIHGGGSSAGRGASNPDWNSASTRATSRIMASTSSAVWVGGSATDLDMSMSAAFSCRAIWSFGWDEEWTNQLCNRTSGSDPNRSLGPKYFIAN
jgi:hypothetical protein